VPSCRSRSRFLIRPGCPVVRCAAIHAAGTWGFEHSVDGIGFEVDGVDIRGELHGLIPEPATAVLVGGGTLLLLVRPRRGRTVRLAARVRSARRLQCFWPVASAAFAAGACALADECGCTDLVVVADVTGSMAGAMPAITQELNPLIDLANATAGGEAGDLRVGLITLRDGIIVNHALTDNVAAVKTTVAGLGGAQGGGPQPYDEAFREILHMPQDRQPASSVDNASTFRFAPRASNT